MKSLHASRTLLGRKRVALFLVGGAGEPSTGMSWAMGCPEHGDVLNTGMSWE